MQGISVEYVRYLTGRSKTAALLYGSKTAPAEGGVRIVFQGVQKKHPEQCETSFALLRTVEQ